MFKKTAPFALRFMGPLAVAFALPLASFGQNACLLGVNYVGGSIEGILCRVLNVINGYIIPLLIALAVVWFIWGVVQFITAKDEEKKGEARSTMIHGIIALFVIVAVWGLVNLVKNFFGVSGGGFQENNQEGFPGL